MTTPKITPRSKTNDVPLYEYIPKFYMYGAEGASRCGHLPSECTLQLAPVGISKAQMHPPKTFAANPRSLKSFSRPGGELRPSTSAIRAISSSTPPSSVFASPEPLFASPEPHIIHNNHPLEPTRAFLNRRNGIPYFIAGHRVVSV